MKKFKRVSKGEFHSFVNTYPKKLTYNIATIAEPPIGSYNDFSEGKKWPASVVAKVTLYDGSDYHGGKLPVYFILDEALEQGDGNE